MSEAFVSRRFIDELHPRVERIEETWSGSGPKTIIGAPGAGNQIIVIGMAFDVGDPSIQLQFQSGSSGITPGFNVPAAIPFFQLQGNDVLPVDENEAFRIWAGATGQTANGWVTYVIAPRRGG